MHLRENFIHLLKTVLTKYEVIPVKRKVSSSIQRKNLGFDLLIPAPLQFLWEVSPRKVLSPLFTKKLGSI